MEFSSARLRFRPFVQADFAHYQAIFGNQQVMEHAWIDRYSTDKAKASFDQLLTQQKAGDDRIDHEFCVALPNGASVGYGSINVNVKNQFGGIGEVGYFLLPEHWGKGYATEIAEALCGYAFGTLGLHRVWARCSANNPASEKGMEKIGMKKEGYFRQCRLKNGRWDDEPRYAILADEWSALHPNTDQ